MNVLFLHNEFPGQFVHLASHLAKRRGHNVVAIGGPRSHQLDAIDLRQYELSRGTTSGILPYVETYELECLHGEAAAVAAAELAAEGFRPDVIVGHAGWGELLFLKEIWPEAKTVAYAEYYYRGRGGDVSYDPEIDEQGLANMIFARAKNAGVAMCMAEADLIVAPTAWQRSCFPQGLRSRIVVVHDGVDTASIRPCPEAQLQISGGGKVFRAGEEIVTYVNRALEPIRGIHVFLRALPRILEARPSAQVLIVGSENDRPYGKWPPQGTTWKHVFLREVQHRLDSRRINWLGLLDRDAFNVFLAVSRVHVYLTYPFVLSWSLIEALSAGCLVVASATPPVAEIIDHGRNGLLVDFFDHEALADTVIEALSQPKSAFAGVRRAARETVITNYDRDTICLPRLVNLIESLVAI